MTDNSSVEKVLVDKELLLALVLDLLPKISKTNTPSIKEKLELASQGGETEFADLLKEVRCHTKMIASAFPGSDRAWAHVAAAGYTGIHSELDVEDLVVRLLTRADALESGITAYISGHIGVGILQSMALQRDLPPPIKED